LEQAKRRAEIRIKEGRAKPIDILAMNLRLANEPDKVEDEIDLEIDLNEPYTIFDASFFFFFFFFFLISIVIKVMHLTLSPHSL
jgi:hypothetical protein